MTCRSILVVEVVLATMFISFGAALANEPRVKTKRPHKSKLAAQSAPKTLVPPPLPPSKAEELKKELEILNPTVPHKAGGKKSIVN